jgi:hypothetical protein
VGNYSKEMHERYVEQQDEKRAKAAQEARERTEKETARRAWLADGGSEGGFEKAWPGLRDAARKQRVMDADRRAREMQRAHGPSRI